MDAKCKKGTDLSNAESVKKTEKGWIGMGKESTKLIANNKKAYHDYFIEDKYEAGIELFGTSA